MPRDADFTVTDAAPPAAAQIVRDCLTPEPKRPLFRALPAAIDFPVDALCDLQPAAEAIQWRTQAPAAICAQAVLAAATLACQAHRDVELPGAGRKPLVGLHVTIAESGERKTSVDRLALAPVYRIEQRWRTDRDAALASFVNDLEAWKAARDHARKAAKGNRSLLKTALDAIGPEPKTPPGAMLLIDDLTPEALTLHLQHSRPWAGVFTAEGATLVGGHSFLPENAMKTAALFNTLWDGSPIRRARVMTGCAFLPGRRCSAHIMMQAVVADRLLGDAMLDGVGLLARMLVCAPESTVGSRPFRDGTAVSAAALTGYDERITALLDRPPVIEAGTTDVLAPPAMVLSAEARGNWIGFHDAAEAELRDGGEFSSIRAFGAKAAEHAGRLAAVLALYRDPDTMEVAATDMAGGIALAQHYACELIRLQGGAAVAPDLQLAQRLLTWWQARPDPRCTLATLYQRGLNAIGDAATARRIVALLEEHGHVRRLPAGTVLDGAARREAWELAP